MNFFRRLTFFLLLVCSNVQAERHEIQVVPNEEAFVEEPSGEQFDTKDVFVASDDWKEILPGQAVPAGLHYRINLQTGKKEAKLLSPDDQEEKSIPEKLKNIPMDDIKGKASDEVIEAIKKKFEGVKANRDIEHIEPLMLTFENATSNEDKLHILDELEYFLHQFDNGRDFLLIGGIDKVIRPGLMSEAIEIRRQICILIGTAAQSQPQVQGIFVEKGILKRLVELLREETDATLLQRCLFAVSSILRGNSKSVEAFTNDLDGFTVLETLSENGNAKINKKLVVLVSDLAAEDSNITEYLMHRGWCEYFVSCTANEELNSDDDTLEKVVEALVQYLPVCKSQFSSFESLQMWLNVTEKKLRDSSIGEKVVALRQELFSKEEL